MVRRGYILGASVTAGLFVFHVAVVPLIFKYSKSFRRHLVFANFLQWPFHIDYDDVSAAGIEGGRNLNIEYWSEVDNCTIKIGVWHILPHSACSRWESSETDKEQWMKLCEGELKTTKLPVILYCHGNSNNRATSHRIQLYKFFQKMDFHTIAFDYRGYGDSTNVSPSEEGVVEDALMVYCWLSDMARRAPVFVWGHSLGTGISSHLLGNLSELSLSALGRELPMPNGLLLEAPFNNLADEVAKHPLSKLVTWLPYYESSFVRPFHSTDGTATFRSDAHLRRVPMLPVLVLHARDDRIVPHTVGKQLFDSIVESRAGRGAPVTLHSYNSSLRLGHKWICLAEDLPQIVGDFVAAHAHE